VTLDTYRNSNKHENVGGDETITNVCGVRCYRFLRKADGAVNQERLTKVECDETEPWWYNRQYRPLQLLQSREE
jgi:hypothetical protein